VGENSCFEIQSSEGCVLEGVIRGFEVQWRLVFKWIYFCYQVREFTHCLVTFFIFLSREIMQMVGF